VENVLSNQKKADIALILVTIFWGFSYVMMDYALTVLHPFKLCAIRFAIAFLFSYIVFFKRMKNVSKLTIKYALSIGVFLTGVYAFTNFGILYTNLTNVGFIVALPVVFTPLINYFFRNIKPNRKLIFVLILATIGMALMTLNEKFVPSLGDVLCLIAALCYAVDIVITDIAVQKESVNALQLGIYVIGVVAVLMTILSMFFGESLKVVEIEIWIVVFLLAVFSTSFAFIVQSVAQQYTSSNHVGLIFTLEPVFAAFAAYFVVGEVLLLRGYVGAFLMLLAVLWAEVDIKSFLKKEKVQND
jgi:drug/metabolite transporter (DMT)-like permease